MEGDWVVDSLVGFLQSPIWKYPVANFTEQKCIGEPKKNLTPLPLTISYLTALVFLQCLKKRKVMKLSMKRFTQNIKLW